MKPSKILREITLGDKVIKLKKVINPIHIAQYGKLLTKTSRDCPIAVTGYAGEGKSVLVKQIANAYDRRFNFDRNFIYGREELKRKIDELPPSALCVDESMNVLYKRDWGTKGQKEVIKLLDLCRFKKHTIIFTQPTFTALDSHVRDFRLRLWIYVIMRGLAVVFRPIRGISYEDPWFLRENNEIINKYIKKLGEIEGRIEGCYHSKNFLAFIRWDDISKEEYEIYEEVKNRKKDDYEEVKLLTPEDAIKQSRETVYDILAVLKYNKKLKIGAYGFVANELGVSNEAVGANVKKCLYKRGLTDSQLFQKEQEARLDERNVYLE
jgi:hypothetical protein